MDLTPRLLTEVEFREEWRGYKREDVDDFLARVATALGELQERLRETVDRAGQAERRLLERSDEDEIRRTLVLAQRTAATALEEARAEAVRVVADAEERVQTRLAEADARLAAVEDEIAERTRNDLAELAQRRATLQADADALQSFVDEHRARLRSELQRQLAALDATAPSMPAAPEVHEVELAAPVHEPIAVAAPEPVAPEPGPEALTFTPTEAEVAQAREDLLEALRRAGVDELLGEVAPEALLADAPVAPEVDPGAEAAEPTPVPGIDPALDLTDDRPQLYDADDESGQIPVPRHDDTAAFDVLAHEDEEPDEVRWREASGPHQAVAEDEDPFLAELRRAVTDTEPLGPRDDDQLFAPGGDDDAVPSGRFRLRRGR
jgi:DivIVA domain-containing protein